MKSNHLWLLKAFVVGAVTVPILMWLALYALSNVTASAASALGPVVIVSDIFVGVALPSGGTLTLTGWKMMAFVAVCGGLLFSLLAGVVRVLVSVFRGR